MRISDWSSDVCSSDLAKRQRLFSRAAAEWRLAQDHARKECAQGKGNVENKGSAECDAQCNGKHSQPKQFPGYGMRQPVKCHWDEAPSTKKHQGEEPGYLQEAARKTGRQSGRESRSEYEKIGV